MSVDGEFKGRPPRDHERGWGDVKPARKNVDPAAAPSHLDDATGVFKIKPDAPQYSASSGMAAHGINARPASHVFDIAPKLRTARVTLNDNLDYLCGLFSFEDGVSVIGMLADAKELFVKDGFIDDPGDHFELRDNSSGNMTVLSLMCPASESHPDLYVAFEYSEKREKWTFNSWVGKRGNQPAGGRRENLDNSQLQNEALRLLTWLKTRS